MFHHFVGDLSFTKDSCDPDRVEPLKRFVSRRFVNFKTSNEKLLCSWIKYKGDCFKQQTRFFSNNASFLLLTIFDCLREYFRI